MQRFYIRQAQKSEGDLNTVCTLSNEARNDLEWWVRNLESLNGKCFSSRIPDLEIYSDASLSGWGAVCNNVTTRGPWTSLEKTRHINELELLGAFFALRSFVGNSVGLNVTLYLDNTSAISYINKCGGTRSVRLTESAKELASFCESQSLTIEAFHLPGIHNVVADKESRALCDAGDWMLNRQVCRSIFDIWPCGLDLFASAWNAQLDSFVSWRPQPGALTTNAFSLNWNEFFAYIFPPFSMILRCVDKIRRDKANAVVICPVWPTQPWFPVLLEMTSDVPRLLPHSATLLTSPTDESHPLIQTRVLKLAAWRLSGEAFRSKAFRNHWSTYSWPASGKTLSQHTNRPGITGSIGVYEGISIPCQSL